ncbi:hypothetical protein OG345_41940 (plasmid) [Streptomyces sp. NBC_01220]|uniref:hypothetical protein n=1 Tax=Streptomyces sp. NBC_01220 TaxID=2903781 RepID=UPI00352CB839|nr:hypothetical protein OG345_41940 [Streptomyces sp. NBC_01220]
MANHAVEDTQAEPLAELRLSEIGLIGALARLLTAHQKKVVTPKVDAPKVPLIKAYTEDGQSELVVKVGDDVIGRYKVNTAQPKIVVDLDNEAALNEYADAHGGTEVVIRRNASWEKALLESTSYDEDTGLIIDSRTGEVVPGLKYEKGGEPTGSLTWTWTQGDAGKKRLMRLYQDGALDHLLKSTPELMAGPRPTATDAQH